MEVIATDCDYDYIMFNVVAHEGDIYFTKQQQPSSILYKHKSEGSPEVVIDLCVAFPCHEHHIKQFGFSQDYQVRT